MAVAKRCKYKNLSNVHLWWMNKRNECQLGRFSFVLKLTCTMWLRFTSSPKIYACRVLYIRTAYDIYDNGYAYLRVGYTDKLFDWTASTWNLNTCTHTNNISSVFRKGKAYETKHYIYDFTPRLTIKRSKICGRKPTLTSISYKSTIMYIGSNDQPG